jgi:glyceraldehyde-3-phosphate dehydrogenase (NADP+)
MLLLQTGLCLFLLAVYTVATTAERTVLPYVVPTQWLPSVIDADQLASSSWQDVTACCRQVVNSEDSCASDEKATKDDKKGSFPATYERFKIGSVPQFTQEQSVAVLQHSVAAWNHGAGVWTQMTLQQRIRSLQNYFSELSKKREEIVNVLMWEIGKNRPDAEAEFDRTVAFAESVIEAIQTDPEFAGDWKTIGATNAYVRRASIGIFLTLAPYNYPLNESYACIIPLLLMGNICILKIPTIGGLVHMLTMEALAKTLPPGTVNFIAGSGRSTMPPLMETGLIDGLAFIGGM